MILKIFYNPNEIVKCFQNVLLDFSFANYNSASIMKKHFNVRFGI